MSALTVSLCLGFAAHAQVYIFNENMLKERMSEIKTTVLDSLTNEPVSYASVYVIPAKDTTITNFTLTDVNGEAKLDEVPFGSYAFHVEMMGYKPVVMERFFREEKVDLGTIRSCKLRWSPMWAIQSSSKKILSNSTLLPSGSEPMQC